MSLHGMKRISVGDLFPKPMWLDHDAGVELDICLLTAGEARRVANGRRDKAVDRPWAKGYPLEGDKRACMAYIGQLAVEPGTRAGLRVSGSGPRPLAPWARRATDGATAPYDGAASTNPFGYYQIVVDGAAVGGIGFHGPPRDGVVEVGYAVVPRARRQGVASRSLRLLLDVAAELPGVRVVCGRTTADNVASQRVLQGAGMRLVGRDPDFLHFEVELVAEPGQAPAESQPGQSQPGQSQPGPSQSAQSQPLQSQSGPSQSAQSHPARWSR